VTAAVLGTSVADLGGDDRPALLLSDLHVPAGGGPVLDQLDALLAQAVRLRARVFVLGDLFDSYVAPAQLRVGVWSDVAARLAAAAREGVALWFLRGNRDFLLGPEFDRATGGRLVPGGIACRLAGRAALLLHGDELCQNDRPYQRAKRWLRHPATRALARALPLRLALWVAGRARARSEAVVRHGDQERFHPTAEAMAAAFASGCELLVYGHIHRPARGAFPGEAAREYCILPAFDAGGVGLLADDAGLHYVRAAAGGLQDEPDPPPRSFPHGEPLAPLRGRAGGR
jgi:UDP-2,3-diacylglucosamine hydrolase